MTDPAVPTDPAIPTDPAAAPAPTVPDRVVLRPERGTFFVAIVFLLGSLPLATSHVALLPLLLLPVACLVWQRRAKVIGDQSGLTICNGWRVEQVEWPDVQGFDRSGPRRVRLLRADQPALALAGLQRRDLPRLLAVGEQAARRHAR